MPDGEGLPCALQKLAEQAVVLDGVDVPQVLEKPTEETTETLLYTCEDSPARLAAIEHARHIASLKEVYWSADDLTANPPDTSSLPLSPILASLLGDLGLSLGSRAQSLATGADCSPVEPLLALYCPVKGGDYIIDNTVRELARQLNADVVVLDAMHILAGGYGHYGATGALLNFGHKQLHSCALRRRRRYRHYSSSDDSSDADDDNSLPHEIPALSVDKAHSPRLFFDLLVNVLADGGTAHARPRIIYVRDHPTLSSSLHQWWPMLQAAVRLRRLGSAPADTTAAVADKTVLIIGAAPPETFSKATTGEDKDKKPGAKPADSDDDDDESGDSDSEASKCREWHKGKITDAKLLDTIACLKADAFRNSLPDDAGTVAIRKAVIVSEARAKKQEKAARTVRRREVNFFTMRMAAGALGAALSGAYEPAKRDELWEEWGKVRIPWRVMYAIAEKAVGRAELAAIRAGKEAPIMLSWDDVHERWDARHALRDMRKSREQSAEKDKEKDSDKKEGAKKDEVVERVKNENLSSYESGLLSCIVDTANMTTGFADVHLPAQTIDAVRSFASLPLLHPGAFDQGILKQHRMKGTLLFGPPGVGKTLIVRALAKECGARMLAIKASNIVSRYVGDDEKNIAAMFSLARRLAPCIVFIDELDAMFSERPNDLTAAGMGYRALTTEFLQEMDGLTSKDDGVLLIGATNRPFDLDDAVLRRLPMRIMVELPSEAAREAILKIHLRDEQLDGDIDIKRLAKETDRFSGSDLKNLVISAALDSVKETVVVPWKKGSENASATDPAKEGETSTTNSLQAASETTKEEPSSTKPSTESTAEPGTAPSESNVDHKSRKPEAPVVKRVLHWRNFAQALTEIWPSASEHLGTHAKLLAWNDKFGAGGRRKKGDDLQDADADHDSTIAKVRRAFDLTEIERGLLKCAIDPASIPTTFEDVHLPARTIDAVRTIVSLPLLHPEAFAHGILKEHGMRGSLLFGPPGTGKTHIVRALARSSGAHMLAVKPSDIFDCHLGQSEKLVSALFALARRLSPCIVFIDEIDAVFSQRSTDSDGGSAGRAHRAVMTEFMQEMDGLVMKGKNVIVIGATNRPFDLDDALLRRLPLRLLVDLPGEREREEILKILLRSETLGRDVDLTKIARDTSKFSGSDLKHLVVGAAMDAVKEVVTVPWQTNSSDYAGSYGDDLAPKSGIVEFDSNTASAAEAAAGTRVLYARHFVRAQRDVQPSAGEYTSTHTKLREWGRKFGTNTAAKGDAPAAPTSNFAGGRDSSYAAGRDSTYAAGRDSTYAAGRDSSYAAGRTSAYAGGRDSTYAPGRDSIYTPKRDSSFAGGRDPGCAPGRDSGYTAGRDRGYLGERNSNFAGGSGSTFAAGRDPSFAGAGLDYGFGAGRESGFPSAISSSGVLGGQYGGLAGGRESGNVPGRPEPSLPGEAREGSPGVPSAADGGSKSLEEMIRGIRERDEQRRENGSGQ